MIEVSAGIIRRGDGQILICQRGDGRHNAHLWEFPGGKREKGESAASCLKRELMEELSLPVSNIQEVCVREAENIRFTFLTCDTDAEPVPTEHEAVRFVPAREMLRYPFCPADTEVARTLALNAPPLRHFFWDFDGTLADTYPALTGILVLACADFGVMLSQERALTLMKRELRYAIQVLAGENGLDADELGAAFRRHEPEFPVREFPAIAGAAEAVRAMPGRHYLVTHRNASAREWLTCAGLDDEFTDAVTKENGLPRKPAPDMLQYLLDKHGIDPQTAVMIGDRPLDTAAGRAAGMLSCLLDTEGRFPDDPCELRANDAFLLPGLLCPAAIK